jgi:hypothetical protein
VRKRRQPRRPGRARTDSGGNVLLGSAQSGRFARRSKGARTLLPHPLRPPAPPCRGPARADRARTEHASESSPPRGAASSFPALRAELARALRSELARLRKGGLTHCRAAPGAPARSRSASVGTFARSIVHAGTQLPRWRLGESQPHLRGRIRSDPRHRMHRPRATSRRATPSVRRINLATASSEALPLPACRQVASVAHDFVGRRPVVLHPGASLRSSCRPSAGLFVSRPGPPLGGFGYKDWGVERTGIEPVTSGLQSPVPATRTIAGRTDDETLASKRFALAWRFPISRFAGVIVGRLGRDLRPRERGQCSPAPRRLAHRPVDGSGNR